jgi:RNA polymerase sigma factor (sigma-70 family)
MFVAGKLEASDVLTGRAEPTASNAEQFGVWVRPVIPAMLRLAARLGPVEDCEDAVQEALRIAWTKRHQFDPARGTASVWLLAITAQQVRLAHRRRRPATVQISVVADSRLAERDAAVDVDLERAIALLSERQRLAVDCMYFVGLSVAETAAVMGCAVGTVKSTLSDARARLRTILKETP